MGSKKEQNLGEGESKVVQQQTQRPSWGERGVMGE